MDTDDRAVAKAQCRLVGHAWDGKRVNYTSDRQCMTCGAQERWMGAGVGWIPKP